MRIVGEDMEIFISDLKPEVREFVIQAFGFHPSDRNLREMENCKPLVAIPIGHLPLEVSAMVPKAKPTSQLLK